MKKVYISILVSLLLIACVLSIVFIQSPQHTSAASVPGLTVEITGDSTINQCEAKPYTISVTNNTGSDLTDIAVTAKLGNMTGFSYVNATSSLDINGGAAFCIADPIINGGYAGICGPAPISPYLTWDIDSLCPATTLSTGDVLNITFDLETDCDAVSSTLTAFIDFDLNSSPECDDTGFLMIQVTPGAVTINMTPDVIPQELGQNVTWTLTVENTGYGVIENVEVTDILDDGLSSG